MEQKAQSHARLTHCSKHKADSLQVTMADSAGRRER